MRFSLIGTTVFQGCRNKRGAVIAALACAVLYQPLRADEPASRVAYLKNLSVTEQEELRRKRETFEGLDEAEQVRMRQLHTSISTSPDSDRLHSVALHYHEWLKTLTAKERADLLKVPAGERVAEIRRLMEQQRQQRFRELVNKPPAPEDVKAIFEWLDYYATAHEEELMDLLPQQMRQRISQPHANAPTRRKMLLMGLGMRGSNLQWPAPTDEDLQKLDESLSQEARDVLAEVPTREQKLTLVREWLKAAVASRMMPQVSQERLLAFYRDYREKTNDKVRVEKMDSLPPDEFYAEVKRMYLRSRGHWQGRRDGDHRRDDHHRPGPHHERGGENGPRDWGPSDRSPGDRGTGDRGFGDRQGDRSGARPRPRVDRAPPDRPDSD